MNSSPIDPLCSLLRDDRRTPLPDDLDELAKQAIRHGVHGMLFHRLSASSWTGSTALTDALRPAAHRSVSVTTQRDAATGRLLADLNRQAIPFMVFKGTPLAYLVYPAPHLRPRADVDLLVDASHVVALRRWLISRGYTCQPLVTPLARGVYLASQFGARKDMLHGPAHVLDVHWQVNNRYALAAKLPVRSLYDGGCCFTGLGPSLLAPSPPHALLIACLHWAGEANRKLIWLYDIHLLASRLEAAASRQLLRLARQTGLLAVLRHLLRECRRCLATPLPQPLTDDLERSPASDRDGPAGIVLRHPGSALHAHLADFMAIRDTRERIRMLSAVLFPPSSYLDLRGIAPGRPLPLRQAIRLAHPLRLPFVG